LRVLYFARLTTLALIQFHIFCIRMIRQAHLHAISAAQTVSNESLHQGTEHTNQPGGSSWLPSLRMPSATLSGTAHGPIDISDLCPERLDRQHVPKLVLKDNDLNYRLVLSPEDVAATCTQLDRDSAFLADEGIMDYSLLIGVSLAFNLSNE